jgi:hypothetical protein
VNGSTERVRLQIRDKTRVIVTLPSRHVRGVYHVSWDLRMVPAGVNEREIREEGARLPLPLVLPGTYLVTLIADTREQSQALDVREDPRLTLTPAQRAAWTGVQVQLWGVVMRAEEQRTKAIALREQAQMRPGAEMRHNAARLRILADDFEETGERAEKLLKRVADKPVPVSTRDSRRIETWRASVARLETDVAEIQQNMRSSKPR